MIPLNNLSYDGFNFVENGLVITNLGYLTIAPRQNQLEPIANRGGAVLVQSQLGTKPIVIEGYYIATSSAAAQTMYDTLAQMLNRQERPLVVPHAGGQRIFTATPENVVISQPDGLNRLTFSFEFVVPTGSSYEITPTTFINASVTSASTTEPVNIVGSVLARPAIIMTFNSVTGGTAKTVSLRNARDLIGLTFTRNFVTGDVILVDSDNFQVYINGVLSEPDGRLPSWLPGSGALYYSDTFTARNVSITGTYIRKDL